MSAGTLAAPSPRRSEIPVRRESNTVTPLSSGQLSDLAPFTRLAGAAYCDSAKVKTWSCGGQLPFSLQTCNIYSRSFVTVNCQNVPGFTPTLTGGDGGAEQFCTASLSSSIISTRWPCMISSLCRLLTIPVVCNCCPWRYGSLGNVSYKYPTPDLLYWL